MNKRHYAIRNWHICIGGFRQNIDEPHGMFRLWQRLGFIYRNAETCVSLRSWRSNWSEIAEQIWLAGRQNGAPPKVFVYGYSWGCGHGFIRLAKELGKRNLRINAAVLSDPVYRSRWLSMSWKSMCGYPVIRIPGNVRHVRWFRQENNRPAGHDLVPAHDVGGRRTIEDPMVVPKVTHEYMDDLQAFHDASVAASGEWV